MQRKPNSWGAAVTPPQGAFDGILQKSLPNPPNTVGNDASASFGWHQAAEMQYLIDFQWFGAQF